MTIRTPGRLAVFAVLFGALALAACGRKGGLDAPPAAYADPSSGAAVNQPQNAGTYSEGSATSLPVIRGPNKRIPLDALLD